MDEKLKEEIIYNAKDEFKQTINRHINILNKQIDKYRANYSPLFEGAIEKNKNQIEILNKLLKEI